MYLYGVLYAGSMSAGFLNLRFYLLLVVLLLPFYPVVTISLSESSWIAILAIDLIALLVGSSSTPY